MKGTVVYSESANGENNSAILTNMEQNVIIKEKPYKWGKTKDPMDLESFELFDYFDDLFGKNTYDTIITVHDGRIWKKRKRLTTIKQLVGINEAIINCDVAGNEILIATR